MTSFDGFQRGDSSIRIHRQFFSDVLPLIDDLTELKVILFCYHALYQKQGTFRYLTWDDFAKSPELRQSIGAPPETWHATLRDALAQAVTQGILLRYDLTVDDTPRTFYFLHTDTGQRAIEQLEAGNWQPDAQQTIEILPERPTIYRLYEDNIGALTAGIAERLKLASEEYPYQWIIDAINIAIDNNVRRWRYIEVILEKWKQEGRQDEATERSTERDQRDYTGGKYADFIES